MDSPTLKIFYDARTVRPRMTGVGRYVFELLAALADSSRNPMAHPHTVSIRALVLESSLPALRDLPEFEGVTWVPTDVDYESHPSGDIALHRAIPKIVQPDEIYHGPAFTVPAFRQKFSRVVTIHDLGVFKRGQDYPVKFALYLRWCIRQSVHCADRVIVPSSAVADEIHSRFPWAHDRISVIHEAPCESDLDSWRTAPESDTQSRGPMPEGENLILSIGTLEPRKDPRIAVRALEIDTERNGSDRLPDWVWVGSPGHDSEAILRDIEASPQSDRFHRVGFRGGGEIQELLRRAAVLVYPSLDEGFGLPPLEAMAAGVPVIVSDIPVLREVCGDAALYFERGNASALAGVLRRLYSDPALQEKLKVSGRRRIERFSWERSARETIEVYRSVSPWATGTRRKVS